MASLHAPIHERQIAFPSTGDFARRVKALEPGHVKVTLVVTVADTSLNQVMRIGGFVGVGRMLSMV